MNLQIYYDKYKWLLMASFFSALTIVSVKYYSINLHNYWLLVSVLSEIGLIYSYIKLLQKSDILAGFSLVKILSILLVLFVSILFLDVKLTNSKIIGIIFAVTSIYLLA